MKYFKAIIKRININSVRCQLLYELSDNEERIQVFDPPTAATLKISRGWIHDRLLSINKNPILSVQNGIIQDVKENID